MRRSAWLVAPQSVTDLRLPLLETCLTFLQLRGVLHTMSFCRRRHCGKPPFRTMIDLTLKLLPPKMLRCIIAQMGCLCRKCDKRKNTRHMHGFSAVVLGENARHIFLQAALAWCQQGTINQQADDCAQVLCTSRAKICNEQRKSLRCTLLAGFLFF